MKKKITVLTPCYNEEDNVEELFKRTVAVFEKLPNYDFDYIFIDNASTDKTVEILKSIAQKDTRLKVIVNSRNFGHLRSPYHAFLQIHADACVVMAADLQTPPEMIPEFVKYWEEGYQTVAAVKDSTEEVGLYSVFRKWYYKLVTRLSDIEQIPGFTGFGLYDRVVLEAIRKMPDPYPYFRGIVAEAGFSIKQIPFRQPLRKKGFTKNNFYTLYDLAILGLVNHSKVPLRLAIFFGMVVAVLSFMIGCGYLVLKLLNWNEFSLGMAPLVTGMFFFSSIQLIFLGVIGEYLAAVYVHVRNRPLVIEKERVNF